MEGFIEINCAHSLFLIVEKSCINLIYLNKHDWYSSEYPLFFADNNAWILIPMLYRLKKLTRSKLAFSKTQRRSSLRKPPRDPDTTRRLVLVSKVCLVIWLCLNIGFKTPQSAIEGTYIDKKCPFTSNISIRGRIFKGVVLSTKMSRTVILRRDYLHYIKKYNRFEKRHHNLPAHLSPAFARTRTGDIVTVGQCRPISKTVRFNVIRVEKKRIEGNVRKTFVMFWVLSCMF